MSRRRAAATFNVSFLDVLCSGLGAVIFLALTFSAHQTQKAKSVAKGSSVTIYCDEPDMEIGAYIRLPGRNGFVLHAPPESRTPTHQAARQLEWRRLAPSVLVLTYEEGLTQPFELGVYLRDRGRSDSPDKAPIRIQGLGPLKRFALTEAEAYAHTVPGVKLK